MAAPPAAPPPSSGNLKDISISGVLHSLKTVKKTGILTVRQDAVTKAIHFSGGEILFSESNYANDCFGEILLKAGAINFKQYEVAKDLLKAGGKTEGSIFLEQGFVKPKIIFDTLVSQVRETVLSLFFWEDAFYSFRDTSFPSENAIGITIDPDEIIYEGWTRISDWVRLTRFLPSFHCVLKKNTGQTEQAFPPSVNWGEVFSLIDGERTIREVITLSSTRALACAQILNGLIATETIIASIPAKKEKPVDEKEAEKPNIEDDLWAQETIVAQVGKMMAIYETIFSKNYYEILGLPKNTEKNSLRRAYFKLAKRYHPDRYVGGDLSDMEKRKIETIFAELTHAYDTLSVDELRKKYDKILAAPAVSKEILEERSIKEDFARGQEAIAKNDLKNGLYFLEEVLRKMPDSPRKGPVYLQYGQMLARVPGKLKDAAEALQKSASMDGSQAAPYFELGLVYVKADLTEKATAAFRDAIRRDTNHKAAQAELAKLGKTSSR
jgi:curved DNA-binding protein CbpA